MTGDRSTAPTPADEVAAVPWHLGDAAVAVLWLFGAQIVVGVAVVAVGVELTSTVTLVATVVAEGVALVGVVGWLVVHDRWSWQALGSRRPRTRHLLLGVATGLGGTVIVLLTFAVVDQLIGPLPPPQQQVLEEATAGGAAAVLAAVLAIAVAPVVEELVFRGLLFQALRDRYGPAAALVWSSLLFGAVHLELLVGPGAGTSGRVAVGALVLLAAWFAWAFHRTGSLAVPVLAHATFNALMLAGALTTTAVLPQLA